MHLRQNGQSEGSGNYHSSRVASQSQRDYSDLRATADSSPFIE